MLAYPPPKVNSTGARMKLRIKGNSLRLRVTRSELSQMMRNGRIENTIQFAPEKDASLTFVLERSMDQSELTVRYRPQEVTIAIPFEEACLWASSDQVRISRDLNVGDRVLAVLVEKDFACLDGRDKDDDDTFTNPNQGSVC